MFSNFFYHVPKQFLVDHDDDEETLFALQDVDWYVDEYNNIFLDGAQVDNHGILNDIAWELEDREWFAGARMARAKSVILTRDGYRMVAS